MASVVIPVYNRAESVLRAIASVLDQSYPVLEVVVVDDGSEDGTAAAIEALDDPRVKVIRHDTNRGSASARNTGITAARGDLIALLDSDDAWMPQKLEKQVRMLTASLGRDPAVVSGFVVHESGRQWPVPLDAAYDVTRDRVWGCHVSPGSTLLTYRSCFESVGLFDENLRRLEDWDWLIRFGEAHRMLVVPEPLTEVHFERQEIADHVAYALAYLGSKHGPRFARRSRWDSRRFRSTLAVELASLEYHRGRWVKAALAILRALVLYPFRNRVFFMTIGRTVWWALMPRFVKREAASGR